SPHCATAITGALAIGSQRPSPDVTRLTDVWLARDGATAFARTLLQTGVVTSGDGRWLPIASAPVMAVAQWGDDGFLLGFDDGRVMMLDGAQVAVPAQRIAKVSGRFLGLVTLGDRAIGLVDSTVISARLHATETDRGGVTEAWCTRLDASMTFECVAGIDVDPWSTTPVVAVLGDSAIVIVDATTGATRARFAVDAASHARWIGPGWLLVLTESAGGEGSRSELRVLDVVSGRWTAPVVTPAIARIAVRGEEIHVGYACQAVAVWDRAEVCRGSGVTALAGSTPVDRAATSRLPSVTPGATGIAHA
ncbi:MAG TPA: hypothetical protein VE861_09935, partial [Gemmatimonadaceae bacterium]|nr:hypothetical protein [Gemmatimonadaceae bacterium]